MEAWEITLHDLRGQDQLLELHVNNLNNVTTGLLALMIESNAFVTRETALRALVTASLNRSVEASGDIRDVFSVYDEAVAIARKFSMEEDNG